ncbi:MAG TPA: bifunctional demethylmenaquinone methyltransferase/2-methoxy-6-polyprenyl-1,4-benzoquinol methylase UbiE [Pirellulales bacterium]|nr:bifunctional demethylmenaquinone methyltransferase/2-methoxy-6-polyprenyl-1,4-benzoquinol methylase UbiE [Pirellulales bacterium]
MAVNKSETRVRRMFGEIAGRYDLLNHVLSLNLDCYWRWRTVREVRPQGDDPILDLCTGTGDLALAYYRATGESVPIVAADFCHPMLVIGRRKGLAAGANGRMNFVEADAQHLPLPDDRFQIVSVAFGLRNVTDTDRGLREMVRVCRPGGRVAVLEFSKPHGPLGTLYQWYFKYLLPWIGQRVSKSPDDAYHYLPQSVTEFPCGEALVERMRDVGLIDVTYRPLTLGVATLYVGRKVAS